VTDPTPFLSTIAAVSATLVAIIGGLLVARFVTLDSEQQGAQQLLDDAEGRLATAQNRVHEARQRLRDWEINDFFGPEVIGAVVGGERDIRELRMIGGYTPLTNDDLAEIAQLVTNEFAKAYQALQALRVGDEDAPGTDWPDFKRLWSDAPEISWDEVWEIAYNKLVESAESRQVPPRSLVDPLEYQRPYMVASLTGTEQAQYSVLRIQRRDDLIASTERAEQRAEDVEAEVAQLRSARDAIIRPKGLAGGLAVLSFFTLVGVIVPLWLMSRSPKQLTARLGEVVFYLFLGGLVLLLGYMSMLANRLAGRWRSSRRSGRPKGAGGWGARLHLSGSRRPAAKPPDRSTEQLARPCPK
jgi:hypothetical protein